MNVALRQIIPIAILLALSACAKRAENPDLVPGYLEAELIEMASPEAGYLDDLRVARGQFVSAGDPLFELDTTPLDLAHTEAEAQAEASQARVEDSYRGLRPDEVAALQADLDEANAALDLATKTVAREKTLFSNQVSTQAALDNAESTYNQALQKVESLKAQMRVAQEGARDYQQKALEKDAARAQSQVDLARWHTEQATRSAPADAIVQDTLYQPGEWVPATRPIVLLRASDLLRVRFFLSPEQVARITLGHTVTVVLPDSSDPIAAVIERVSDSPEYTPPVIFSREQTAKLVFLVEARLPAENARTLHPGLPVSVQLK